MEWVAERRYDNFISLGYFCDVAQNLEKMGLRDVSSPFDWSITYFDGVIKAIDNRFDGFMDYANLSQSVHNRNHYMDVKYRIFFFHDFSKYESLDDQYNAVKNKYDRRIKKFLGNIEKPTLFIRYVSNEILNENGKSTELEWIEENYEYIMGVLKSFNEENDILFIGDEAICSDVIKIYHVSVDENDVVSRNPIINNEELYPIMNKFYKEKKEENIRRFIEKQHKKKNIVAKIKGKIVRIHQKLFCRVYIYTKEYDVINK